MILSWNAPWQSSAQLTSESLLTEAVIDYQGRFFAEWSGQYNHWHLVTSIPNWTYVLQTEALTPAPSPEIPERFSGGVVYGGFLHEYGRYLSAARRKRRKQEELEEESRALKDKVDREIAELLRLQEAEDEKRNNLARLQRLVQKYSKDALELSDRAKIAYVRALTQANFSALEALDRELQRMLEEEEVAALMMLLNED